MIGKKIGPLSLLLIVIAVSLPVTATAQDAAQKDGWQFFVDIYGWMPDIKGEAATQTDFEIDLGTILDDLQFTVMSVLGVQKDKWTFAVDVVYLDMEDDNTSTKQLPHLPWRPGRSVNVKTNVEMKSWIVTPTVSYHVLEQGQFKLDLLAGARYLYLDVELEVDIDGIRDHERSASGSDSDHVWDGIVGVRGEVTLNEKWYLPYYLDIGTGNSEVTYQAFGGVGYRFSRFDLVAGYRYLRWNFDDSPVFDNMYIAGPMAGVKIRF